MDNNEKLTTYRNITVEKSIQTTHCRYCNKVIEEWTEDYPFNNDNKGKLTIRIKGGSSKYDDSYKIYKDIEDDYICKECSYKLAEEIYNTVEKIRQNFNK